MAAISIAAFFKIMKKKITILFIIATALFCVQLYKFLFLMDKDSKNPVIIWLGASIIVTCIVIVWLFNTYIRLTSQKGNKL